MMYIRHFEQKQTTIKRKKKKENTPPVYSVFSYIQVYKIERHPFTYTPIILTMEIFNRLPREVRVLVNTFSVEHRPNLEKVHVDLFHQFAMDELLYDNSWTYCANDMCEREILKDESVMSTIMDYEHHFCNDECESYGSWSIWYDYRKYGRTQGNQGSIINHPFPL